MTGFNDSLRPNTALQPTGWIGAIFQDTAGEPLLSAPLSAGW